MTFSRLREANKQTRDDGVNVRARPANDNSRNVLVAGQSLVLNHRSSLERRFKTFILVWQDVPYLEPSGGSLDRRRSEASPSSLGSNPGGPPSCSERGAGPRCCRSRSVDCGGDGGC